MADSCRKGGWILGHTVDGTQAEYVRIRYADNSLFPVPPGVDERSLLVFSDILPTGLEVGTLRGKVTPGCTVAIVGAGEYKSIFLLLSHLHLLHEALLRFNSIHPTWIDPSYSLS